MTLYKLIADASIRRPIMVYRSVLLVAALVEVLSESTLLNNAIDKRPTVDKEPRISGLFYVLNA